MMKRIGKLLRLLFSRSSAARSVQNEVCSVQDEVRGRNSVSDENDRLLALQVRKTVEDGRLFLRPDLSLADVAAEMKVEVDTLERIFAHFIGDNFNRYLDELRIAYAALLFMGRDSYLYSIDKMSVECGFPNHLNFSDACLILTGMTPELIRDFTRDRKSLKGLFLVPPVYMSAISPDTLEDEGFINK